MTSMTQTVVASLIVLVCSAAAGRENDKPPQALSREQQLIVASFRLEVDRVKELLTAGVSVNATMGQHDWEIFRDKWTLGVPLASAKWTPLLAVANSNREPEPERETENTTEARNRAWEEKNRIDPKQIKERDDRRVAVAKMLVAAKAKLNERDRFGRTALGAAVEYRHEDLALLLMEAGAEVNTKMHGIDGPGAITSLHEATRNPRVVKALLAHGAKVDARDSRGETPLHWAALAANDESIRLLVAAGADVNAKNKEGRTPLSWAMDPDIAELLRKAGAK